MSGSNRARRSGFTLIELMVSLTILAIILAIVYGAYSSVVNSIEEARLASERLLARQFIERSLGANLAQASEGWSPGAAYRAAGVATGDTDGDTQGSGRGIMRYPFLGARETTANGPADQLSFVTSTTMVGGAALPGAMKLCTYEITEREDDVAEATGEPGMLLTITESPWVEPGLGREQTFTGPRQAADLVRRAGDDIGVKPATVTMPVYAWELAYFDGKQWLDQWDAHEVGRLPWSVRVRVKISSQEDDAFSKSFKLDPETDPNVIEMLIPVPTGMGVYDSPPDYVRPSDRGAT